MTAGCRQTRVFPHAIPKPFSLSCWSSLWQLENRCTKESVSAPDPHLGTNSKFSSSQMHKLSQHFPTHILMMTPDSQRERREPCGAGTDAKFKDFYRIHFDLKDPHLILRSQILHLLSLVFQPQCLHRSITVANLPVPPPPAANNQQLMNGCFLPILLPCALAGAPAGQKALLREGGRDGAELAIHRSRTVRPPKPQLLVSPSAPPVLPDAEQFFYLSERPEPNRGRREDASASALARLPPTERKESR